MKWFADLLNIAFLVVVVALGVRLRYECWPQLLALVLILGIREARRLIPPPRDLSQEKIGELEQRISDLSNKVSRLELVGGLRSKGHTNAPT